MTSNYLTTPELEAGVENIRQSPKDSGRLELIVRRPAHNERDTLHEAELCLINGLVGDNWKARGSTRMPDGVAHPDLQLTIMNARSAALIAGEKRLWGWAGDQLYIDLDLSGANIPAGTRLSIGTAVIEITAEPHTGCKKFAARFGAEALQFVNSPIGRELNLRGINARVVQPGTLRAGDVVKKV